jgi:DNA polymerase-3 subunit delta
MECLTFLERVDRLKAQPLYVLYGDEDFLKRLAREAIQRLVLGQSETDEGATNFPGERAVWAAVVDELNTLPMLGPRRLVVIEEADPFVSRERARLENLVQGFKETKEIKGVLVLEVKTWTSSTRLAKMVSDNGSINCKSPAASQLPAWCQSWCQQRHSKELANPAARLLVELIGPEMGLLNQEMAKLAAYVGSASRVETADVDKLVGNSRVENTWKIFDLVGEANPGAALGFLNRLLDQGEDPLRLLGAFSMQMRRLALAGRLAARGMPLGRALERASIPPFPAARQSAERQVRHLGQRRLDSLPEWLLQTDLALKGSSGLPPRLVLERFVLQLARPRT